MPFPTVPILNGSGNPVTVNTLPNAGQNTKAETLGVNIASDDDIQAKLGIVTETAPASDTASSGLNGRLQRIAQRLTSLIAQIPPSLGIKTAANSLSITHASDDALITNTGSSADGILTTGVAGSLASYLRTIMESGLSAIASAMNLTQVGSTTIATGNGVAGGGVQRVTVASDNSVVPTISTMPANQTTGDTGAKVATGNGATQTNPGYKGIQIVLNLGTVSGTTPTLVLSLQGSVDGGTTWYNLPGTNSSTASLVASGVFGICLYPGMVQIGGTTVSGTTASSQVAVPPTWRVVWTIGGTTPSFTITNIQYNYLV